MSWKTIRLELAQSEGFPNGSVARAYLLRLPLDEQGFIDEAQLHCAPERATVRRHWPNQADRNGRLVRKGRYWAFSYAVGDEDEEALHQLETHAMTPGAYVTVTEADGGRLPYRVVSCDG